MNPFLDTALAAARAAITPIMGYFRGEFDIETKDDATPVTVADRAAERVIRGVLGEAFPDHGIYGEEYGADTTDTEYLWLVDPIDGTKSFVRGQGVFSTQIALMHQGELVVGVSSAPAMGELAWAAKGEGAWLEDRDGVRPLTAADTATIGACSLSTGNLSTMADGPRWATYGELVQRVARTRGYGDFYHYHRLAEGQLDAVVESDVNILDIAALAVIVREAGGVFTDLDGAPLGLETRSVLAATASLHPQLLALFNPGGGS